MNELVLTGLDGSNPLGFMAALGVLEVLSDEGEMVTLRWRQDGVWRPVVAVGGLDLEELIERLDRDRESCKTEPALDLEYGGTRDLKPPPGVFRSYLASLVDSATPQSRRSVDWAAAFATDVAVDNNGNTKPTALHFTAGTQTWLSMVFKLRDEVTPDDLREALLGPWSYERTLPVLGWDATASRDYALRASNPSHDKKAGVPGADWLAVRGLPCLPVVPEGRRVLTTGCAGEWKTGRFTWPLWGVALPRSVVRSLLRLRGLREMPLPQRRALGLVEVFECSIKRSDQGGYGGFSPSAVI
jgi:hypothetical protein